MPQNFVEALIEGKLTEAELINAEQALQAGNDYFDRRILTRLKTDGVDGQGPALFSDLDELYHLLTQAAED
jgi:type I restriction enzyme S subunit